MRVWSLQVVDGVTQDAVKFAQLLASEATDVVWVGAVDCVDSDGEGEAPDIYNVAVLDAQGNPVVIEAGRDSLDGSLNSLGDDDD
jgi:hypothetical protein